MAGDWMSRMSGSWSSEALKVGHIWLLLFVDPNSFLRN